MTDQDPYRHWDGHQWLRWDGQAWVPEQQTMGLPQPRQGNWFRRHKIVTGVLAAFALFMTIGIIGNAVDPVKTKSVASSSTTPTTARSTPPTPTAASTTTAVAVATTATTTTRRAVTTAPTTRTTTTRPKTATTKPKPTTTKPKPSVRVFANCADMNAVYPHGVGRSGAVDHTSGTPVTNFYVNTALYNANTARDRDGDGIACERH